MSHMFLGHLCIGQSSEDCISFHPGLKVMRGEQILYSLDQAFHMIGLYWCTLLLTVYKDQQPVQ